MLRRILIVGGACLGMALMVSPALGQRNLPKKAGKFQATLVQGVEACTATNTTAPGILATAACDPIVPSDSVCVFTEKGSGSVAAKAKDDIAVQAKAGGLAEDCNGETLCAVAGIRSSFDDCGGGSDNCTSIDNPNQLLGLSCCTVEKGKCKIKTTLQQSFPGAVVPGHNSEFAVFGAGLLRTGQPAASWAFRAGLLLP